MWPQILAEFWIAGTCLDIYIVWSPGNTIITMKLLNVMEIGISLKTFEQIESKVIEFITLSFVATFEKYMAASQNCIQYNDFVLI